MKCLGLMAFPTTLLAGVSDASGPLLVQVQTLSDLESLASGQAMGLPADPCRSARLIVEDRLQGRYAAQVVHLAVTTHHSQPGVLLRNPFEKRAGLMEMSEENFYLGGGSDLQRWQ